MAEIVTLKCDLTGALGTDEDPVIQHEFEWEGERRVIDARDSAWAPYAENMAILVGASRPVEKAPRHPRPGRRQELDRLRKWCERNKLEPQGRGAVPEDLDRAWRANDPSIVPHRYLGDDEVPTEGVMPPEARPPGWQGHAHDERHRQTAQAPAQAPRQSWAGGVPHVDGART